MQEVQTHWQRWSHQHEALQSLTAATQIGPFLIDCDELIQDVRPVVDQVLQLLALYIDNAIAEASVTAIDHLQDLRSRLAMVPPESVRDCVAWLELVNDCRVGAPLHALITSRHASILSLFQVRDGLLCVTLPRDL